MKDAWTSTQEAITNAEDAIRALKDLPSDASDEQRRKTQDSARFKVQYLDQEAERNQPSHLESMRPVVAAIRKDFEEALAQSSPEERP